MERVRRGKVKRDRTMTEGKETGKGRATEDGKKECEGVGKRGAREKVRWGL